MAPNYPGPPTRGPGTGGRNRVVALGLGNGNSFGVRAPVVLKQESADTWALAYAHGYLDRLFAQVPGDADCHGSALTRSRGHLAWCRSRPWSESGHQQGLFPSFRGEGASLFLGFNRVKTFRPGIAMPTRSAPAPWILGHRSREFPNSSISPIRSCFQPASSPAYSSPGRTLLYPWAHTLGYWPRQSDWNAFQPLPIRAITICRTTHMRGRFCVEN